jgi:hypothetical protein
MFKTEYRERKNVESRNESTFRETREQHWFPETHAQIEDQGTTWTLLVIEHITAPQREQYSNKHYLQMTRHWATRTKRNDASVYSPSSLLILSLTSLKPPPAALPSTFPGLAGPPIVRPSRPPTPVFVREVEEEEADISRYSSPLRTSERRKKGQRVMRRCRDWMDSAVRSGKRMGRGREEGGVWASVEGSEERKGAGEQGEDRRGSQDLPSEISTLDDLTTTEATSSRGMARRLEPEDEEGEAGEARAEGAAVKSLEDIRRRQKTVSEYLRYRGPCEG